MVNNKTLVNGKWLYGDCWDKFPIGQNEIWKVGPHKIMVADIIKDDITKLFEGVKVDMSYIDPPWNLSNINSFYTKANKTERFDFISLIKKLISIVKIHSPKINYMEMGFQNLEFVKNLIVENGGVITNTWEITYYKTKPCYLIRYTFTNELPSEIDLKGIDDENTPEIAIKSENVNTILDLCTGRGLTGRTSHKLGKTFIGTELNQRRLANLIEFFNKQNLNINKE